MTFKILTFLYFFLVLLTTTVPLSSNQVTQLQNPFEKFQQEVTNIVKDFKNFVNGDESSRTSQTSIYSAEEYGSFAVALNKFKQLMEFSKQDARDFAHVLKEVNIGNVFTDDVFFDLFKIVEKKKNLERLSIFLEESEKKAEKANYEYNSWILSSSDLDEVLRKSLLEVHYKHAEKNEFFRNDTYRIKKNLVYKLIELFDFLSKIYGTYEKGENSWIICTNEHDISILNSYFLAIAILVKEEINLDLLHKQYFIEMEKSFIAATKIDPIPAQIIEEYVQAQSLLNCLEKFIEFCRQETINTEQALAEIDVNSICTEEVIFNLVKISEKKKKLEKISITLHECEKKWDKLMPDMLERMLSSPHVDDQIRKKMEGFNKSVPSLIKQSFAIRKKYVFEFLKLLNLLSLRHGTYKLINNNKDLRFSSDIESKLYGSYVKNVVELFKEEQNVFLLFEQCMHDLSK